MNEKLCFEAFYPHSPERVWRALTESKALSEWLMPANFEPKLGFRFRFEEGALQVTGEVLAVEEGKTLTYSWEDGESGQPSIVQWSLEPTVGGTKLRLDHEILEAADPYVLIEASTNWGRLIGTSIPAVLARTYPPTPMVYVSVEDEQPPKLPRAGFRQEVVTCS